MSQFLNKNRQNLVPYTPGEQPKDQQYIKLNTNELPYAPTPKLQNIISDQIISDLRLYPDPESDLFLKSVSQYYDLPQEQIYVGNGSDEVLAFVFMAFLDQVQFADITYGFYPVYADLFESNSKIIPLREDFSLSLDDYEKDAPILIANPNAPTGIALSVEEIEKALQKNRNRLIIVDEAYIAFGAESARKLIGEYSNLLIIGTLSKSWGLAGMRAGIAMGQKELIEDIKLIKYSFNSYNINRITNLFASIAVDDVEYEVEVCRKVIQTRERIALQLSQLGFKMTDSKANFLFVEYPDFSGKDLLLALRKKGILVRHFDLPRITNYLRISIGTDSEMDQLVKSLKEIVGGSK